MEINPTVPRETRINIQKPSLPGASTLYHQITPQPVSSMTHFPIVKPSNVQSSIQPTSLNVPSTELPHEMPLLSGMSVAMSAYKICDQTGTYGLRNTTESTPAVPVSFSPEREHNQHLNSPQCQNCLKLQKKISDLEAKIEELEAQPGNLIK